MPGLSCAVVSHFRYGAAALAIAADAAPCQPPLTRSVVTDENAEAAEPGSPARPCRALAASSIGPSPAPMVKRAELISGGSTAKFITRP